MNRLSHRVDVNVISVQRNPVWRVQMRRWWMPRVVTRDVARGEWAAGDFPKIHLAHLVFEGFFGFFSEIFWGVLAARRSPAARIVDTLAVPHRAPRDSTYPQRRSRPGSATKPLCCNGFRGTGRRGGVRVDDGAVGGRRPNCDRNDGRSRCVECVATRRSRRSEAPTTRRNACNLRSHRFRWCATVIRFRES